VGARVVGIAGSDDKVKYLTEKLGFDHAINYKTTPDLKKALAEACPKGADSYFDNVGGDISDAVYSVLNTSAKVAICGQISSYNDTEVPVGPRIGHIILKKRLLVRGFIISLDYGNRLGEGTKALVKLYQEGKLIIDETVVEGFEHIIHAFISLFTGANTGKLVIKIADYSRKK